MKRPDVKLDNFEEVYDFYETHEQSKVFARIAHVLLARRYRVTVTCDEGVEEAIRTELRAGSRVIISPNHITADDQYVIVSLVQEVPALHPLRGNTFIPAEPSLFVRPGVAGRMLRRAVDGLGALPTFRLEDLKRQGIELTDEIRSVHQRSMLKSSDAQVSKLIRGSFMAGFWEGTRNRTDYRVVQPLKNGMGHTAIAASKEVRVLLLPMGIYYGGEPSDYRRPRVPKPHAPHVHLGMPIPVETGSAGELVALVHPAIQSCVDHAVAQST